MKSVGDAPRGLRGELRGLFAKAKMPSSPALASRILSLIRDSKSDAAAFGAVLGTDPALAARLLKMANSAHFAQRDPVTTIERAVVVLGLKRVKTISLGFELVGHLDRLGGAPFDMKTFWQHSLLRACLARSIARQVADQCEEEAFLIGLLQDFGILLLVQTLGCGYAGLYRSTLSPTAFHAVERETFPHTHLEAISVMSLEWNLPKIIAGPLNRHHQRPTLTENPSETERLVAVSYFVGSLCFASDLTVDREEQSLREFGATALGLDETTWAEVQEAAVDEYRRVSTLYGDVLPEDVDVVDLLGEANHQLSALANDADQHVLNVESERDTIRQEQRRLANALREYRERSALDPLTNVLNRGALTEAARKAIRRNLDEGSSVGVFFIDLDNFKTLNDTCGHQAGDTTLRAVAACLDKEAGSSGFVGRYGGEEFVVIVQEFSAKETRAMGERIVERVRSLDIQRLGFPGRVTCSVGAVQYDCVPMNSGEELLAAADQLMYRAKRSGKDRCCFESGQESAHGAAADRSAPSRWATRGASRKANPGEPAEVEIQELITVAERLNARDGDTFVGIRKQPRKQLINPCVLHHFPEAATEMQARHAVTRNISTGGIGLVLARPMLRGEVVEVALDRGDSKLFLAGLVAFCRKIEGRVHEIGVQFVAHSVAPVISADPLLACQKYDWVTQSLQAKYEGKLKSPIAG